MNSVLGDWLRGLGDWDFALGDFFDRALWEEGDLADLDLEGGRSGDLRFEGEPNFETETEGEALLKTLLLEF